MKEQEELKEFWDKIEPVKADDDDKWKPAHKHGASKVGSLEDYKQQEKVMLDFLGGPRPEPGSNVLDFGCGVGRNARQLAAFDCNVKTVDVSPKIIDYAREYCKGKEEKIDFILADGYGCGDAPDDWADLAISTYVFQHMPSVLMVGSCLKDIHRVLKKGKFAIIQGRVNGEKKDDVVNLHGVNLTCKEFCDLAEAAGFKILHSEYPYKSPEFNWYRVILEK